MSVYNAGMTIKEARMFAGLSQKQLSDGIISLTSLSRIENGHCGIDPSTFQALMTRAGAPCEIFPIFENWNDYEVYSDLIHARFHLDAWQLDKTYESLKKVEIKTWNHNKLHYQTWLLIYGALQFRSGCDDHQSMYTLFKTALHITKANIDFSKLDHTLLSRNEVELLICIAQESLYLDQLDICWHICTQLFTHLENRQITYMEKDKLLAECAAVYIQYLIFKKQFADGKYLANQYLHQIKSTLYTAPVFELSFLLGICDFYLHDSERANTLFMDVLYASKAISSPFATIAQDIIKSHHLMILSNSLQSAPLVQLKKYPDITVQDYTEFSNGIFDVYAKDVITLGRLISGLRMRQHISQETLCQGLCSKSHLSKIENDSLMPRIILAEALLQRLGISNLEFNFWGNGKETDFYNLKIKLQQLNSKSPEKQKHLLQLFKDKLTAKDVLYNQQILFEESFFIDDPLKRLPVLKKLIEMTHKNFCINNINHYRLSWIELDILQEIAQTYLRANMIDDGMLYIQQNINYHVNLKTDCILQSHTLTNVLLTFFEHLCTGKHYKQILELFAQNDLTVLKYNLTECGSLYFYYSQALSGCHKHQESDLYAQYSRSILRLIGSEYVMPLV